MTTAANVDMDLERAMVAEAVYAHERYLAFGVGAQEYSSAELRGIAEAAHEAWEVDGTVTLETVGKALQRVGKLGGLGGVEGLAKALTSPAVADPERFVELRRLRDVHDAAMAVAKAARAGSLDAALAALGQAQTTAVDAGRVEVLDAFDLGTKLLEALQQKKLHTAFVHPGLECVQRCMGDMPLGCMTVLGGGTNVGKSSIALKLLVAAAQRNVGCGFVSCEDAPILMSSRLLSEFSGLSARKLASGRIDPHTEWSNVVRTVEPLREISPRLGFAFAVGGTEIDVCAAMSRLAMRGAKIIVVDYVQAVQSSKAQQDRRNEVRWLSARLKAHAQRLNVHLLLLSQLGRPPKGEDHREPSKHDLKEAGDLENAADWIFVIWREQEDDFAPIHVKLAKSKNGNVGARFQMERDQAGVLRELPDSYQSAQQQRQDGGR